MRSGVLGVLTIVALLALAAPAAAQTVTIDVQGPDAPVSVASGQSTTVNVNVNFLADEFGCSQDTPAPVAFTAAAGRVTATGSAEELTYTLPTGLHNSQAPGGGLPPLNASQSATITVDAPAGEATGFSDQITVTASFEGGDFLPNCGPGEFPSAEGTATINVNVQGTGGTGTDGGDGGTGSDGGDGGAGGNNTGGNGGDEETDDSPLAAWLLPAALIGAALIARREH